MKLFSTLFLSLALITGAAQANNELQEKLAQALSDGDHNAIEQALAAGANPFICHKTNVARNEALNLLSEDAKAEILAAEEISPYYGLFYVHQAARNNEAILRLTETLLKNDVSVDREPTASHGGFGYTFRQFIDLGLGDCESILENNVPALTEVQREEMAFRVNLFKQLLTLMQKYQPIEMEYASSFRFTNKPEVKA